MTEILGVVASGLSIGSVAAQIFTCVQNIKHLWSAIKDAPEDVQILFEELDLLARLLCNAVDVESASPDRRGATIEAVCYCEKARVRIETVIKDLSGGFIATEGWIKHWTAMKTVMQEKRLKKCFARLERAKSMLNLALQCLNQSKIDSYQSSQSKKLQIIEEILVKATSELNTAPSVTLRNSMYGDSASIVTSVKHHNRVIDLVKLTEASYWLIFWKIRIVSAANSHSIGGTRNFDQSRRISIRPVWFSQRDFEFVFEHIYGAWRFTFRTYRIITTEDPVFQACVSGNITLVKVLCSKGQASPFDVLTHGWTLLHLAAALSLPELCIWLIDQGLDGNCTGYGKAGDFQTCITPLMVATRYKAIPKQSPCAQMTDFYHDTCLQNENWILYRDIEDLPSAIETFRALIEHGGSNPMQSDKYHRSAIHRFKGSADVLRYLLHQEYFQIDLLEEDDFSKTAIENQFWRLPDSLAGGDLILEEFRAKKYAHRLSLDENKLRFLHKTAHILMWQYRRENSYSRNSINILKHLIEAGADLHGLLPDRYGSMQTMTPLRCIVDGNSTFLSCEDQNWQKRFKDGILNSALRAWMKILGENKVNLRRYLQEEERLAQNLRPLVYKSSYSMGTSQGNPFSSSSKYNLEWHFEYGDNENTCSITVEYILDNSEKPAVRPRQTQPGRVPGAWIDED